ADDCRASETRLCILVVGPVTTYPPYHGQSPLAQILADWRIDVPVLDVAIEALMEPDFPRLLLPRDGHLTGLGPAYVAPAALPPPGTRLRSPGRPPPAPGPALPPGDRRLGPLTTPGTRSDRSLTG